MALLFINQSFTALHGSKDVRSSSFSVEVTIEGGLIKGFVAGIDHDLPQAALSKTVRELEGNYLDDLVGRATNENIAAFLLFSLRIFPLRSVKVADAPCSCAQVFFHEINVDDYPAQLLLERGRSLLFRGQPEAALKILDEAIQLKRQFAEAHNLKGRCFKELKEYHFALEAFREAVLIKPNWGEAHRNLGNAYLFLNQHEMMIPAFTAAIALMPNSPVAFNNRGFAFQQLGAFDLAIIDHTRALELEPCYAEAYSDRAMAYAALGKTDLADDDRKKAGWLIESENDAYAPQRCSASVGMTVLGNEAKILFRNRKST